MQPACSLVLLVAQALASGSVSGDTVLGYGDGKQDDRRSTAGRGHAVAFQRPDDHFTVTAVQVHGSRYGGNYDPYYAVARISLCDAEMNVLAQTCASYDNWSPGNAEWVEVAIGPCLVPAEFLALVEFFPTSTKGVFLSIDQDSSGHSFAATPGSIGQSLESGEWMIRVRGTDREVKVETPDLADMTVLAQGSGEPVGKQSVGGNGHVVVFKRPSKHTLLTGIALCGQLYGRGYDPEQTLFHIFICDKKLKVLTRSVHPYALFSGDTLGWVDLKLPPTKVPRDFAVVVYFEPIRTKGVYLGKWQEEGNASLLGLPQKVGSKLNKGEGWMMRASVAASAGEKSLEGAVSESEATGPGALEIAALIEKVDEAEVEEDVLRANDLVASLAEIAPDDADRLGRFEESEHFLLRHRGLTPDMVRSLLGVMEAAHGILTEQFGFASLGAFGAKKVHLDVRLGEGEATSLFTNPQSKDFSQIVLRGTERAMASPSQEGPHVVYGFCHELGHVVIGWEDDQHQWAHYLGSVVTTEVHKKLGDEGWWAPYNFHEMEGMPRLLKEIGDVGPGLKEKGEIARLFYEVGEKFGLDVYAKALAWIRDNRKGKLFHAVRLYRLEDLRAALNEVADSREEVALLFGDQGRSQ